MRNRLVTILVLVMFLSQVIGCSVYTTKEVPKEDLQEGRRSASTGEKVQDKIVEVVYVSGRTVTFDESGARYNEATGVIKGMTPSGRSVEIAVNDVLYVRVERLHLGKSVLKTVVVVPLVVAAVGVGVVLVALAFSCPYVYSFDGAQYVFDAEPLGGSVSRGLQREDYSKLEHLRAVDGKYRLRVSNETDETQFLDAMKLIVVDHAPESDVVPDRLGNMHVVTSAVSPQRAVDENGADLRGLVGNQDDMVWQSLPMDPSYRETDLRHELIFEFPKPMDTHSANLIVDAGTALWGSNMIKEMLQLRGDQVDSWYESIDTGGPAAQELFNFNVREELYFLKFYIKDGEGWKFGGWVPGGGPLITEARAIPVDLSGIVGDKVTIRVNPPKGFWTFDYMALESGDQRPVSVIEQPIVSARDQDGQDVRDLIGNRDGHYQVMPRIGDRIDVEFEVPPQQAETKRTVFLMSYGYYQIHTDKSQPEQTALIAEILGTEGHIVEYSMGEYAKWFAEHSSRR